MRGRWGYVGVIPLLVLFLLATLVGQARESIEIIKLRSGSAGEIMKVLRAMYSNKELRMSEAPSVNGLVLGGDADLIADAKRLIAQLDKPPRMLTYAIEHVGNRSQQEVQALLRVRQAESENGRPAPISVTPDLQSRQSSANVRASRTVSGIEGQKVSLTDTVTRVETLPSPYGPTGVVLQQTTGLWVRGNLSGDDMVTLTLGYGEGDTNISSVVSGRLGTWIPVGGMNTGRGGVSSQGGVTGQNGTVGRNWQSSGGVDSYLIRVEVSP